MSHKCLVPGNTGFYRVFLYRTRLIVNARSYLRSGTVGWVFTKGISILFIWINSQLKYLPVNAWRLIRNQQCMRKLSASFRNPHWNTRYVLYDAIICIQYIAGPRLPAQLSRIGTDPALLHKILSGKEVYVFHQNCSLINYDLSMIYTYTIYLHLQSVVFIGIDKIDVETKKKKKAAIKYETRCFRVVCVSLCGWAPHGQCGRS